jgi:uncharacterized membrane protein
VTIQATPSRCFDYVAEPGNIPRFMAGIKRNEPLSEQTTGRGARFHSVAVVAGREIEAELEMTTWQAPRKMVVTSVEGPSTRGTWTFADTEDGATEVHLKYEYELPMMFRVLPGGVVRGTIEKGLEQSLEKLKQQVEGSITKTTRQRQR